ncbi:DUF397 domain-containing protein [Actinokineospora spheciospongiae]|uniref:DUF397 domain-containing protein n=1 Tax=Actinokineospora spheciospongiae TaxID=909613 RepID=UPI000D8F3722|nr:DUF397 domain-containing protein [Actinokineospora spheciospongiae]PWW56891.1 uncharacterized protein DUF397 [Actinokineospora spheciospongiae]
MRGAGGSGWVRSRRCGRQFDCVEVNLRMSPRVAFRDSKAPQAGVLALSGSALPALVAYLRQHAVD